MRATNAPASRERRRRRLKLARGFYGARSKQFRLATEAVDRAQRLATNLADAKVPNYSRFIEGLNKAGVTVNRKMLSEIAIADAEGFKALVAKAAAAL